MQHRALEPIWINRHSLLKFSLPRGLSEWLFTMDSMTVKLREFCKQQFKVEVLFHHWARARPSEYETLNISLQPAIIRQTRLICDHQVLIYARSVFPKHSLQGKNIALRHLDKKPIGDFIYRDPMLYRRSFEIAKLRAGHQDYEHAVQTLSFRPELLWARRSVFYVYGQPILISEVFLPAVYDQK